jgi:hypothetical protein
MRIRPLHVLALLAALACGGCAGPAPAAEPAPVGIDCACCFTIVEFVRSNPRPDAGRLQVQCEACCEVLTFTVSAHGQLMVSRPGQPEPLPTDLCVPAPPR